MNADAIDDPPRLRRTGVALDHHVLDRHSAFDGGDDGGKLEQQTVAGSSRRLPELGLSRRSTRAGSLWMPSGMPHKKRARLLRRRNEATGRQAA
jgi:hypothetical protein